VSSVNERQTATRPAPPLAEPRPHRFSLHGVELQDDYAWLKAPNWKDVLKDASVLPPDIRAHLERECAYTADMLADTGPLQTILAAEMRGRIKEDDSSVPEPDGPWSYFTRFRDGGQHPLICRQPRDGGAEEIMLDGDAEADDRAYFDLNDATHSPDHALLAWSADITGSELHTIRVRDLAAEKTSRTRSGPPPATWSGPWIRPPSTTSRWTTIIGRPGSTGTGSAPSRRPTNSSTSSRCRAGSSISTRPRPAPSRSSR
jgi:protease II